MSGPGGRPTKYDPEMLPMVEKLAEAGCTEAQIAVALKVDYATLRRWKKAHPEFCAATKSGKVDADGEVIRSLWERATGYSHEEDKIFCNADGEVTKVKTVKHYPPDTGAAAFWLKNRKPDDWRDRKEIGHTFTKEQREQAIKDAKQSLGLPTGEEDLQ